MRVALMVPCYMDMFYPRAGVATDEHRRVVLVGETAVMTDVVHDCAREALRRLQEAHAGEEP